MSCISITIACNDMNQITETNIKQNYKVPRILWENLEAVLLSQSKKYIEELAKVLQVPAKELQKRVMPSSQSITVMIQDVQEHVCQAYVQKDAFTVYCRKPVFNGHFCASHTAHRALIQDARAETIQRIKDVERLPPLWIKGTDLYTSDGQKQGTIHHARQKIKIYVLENA